MYTDIVLTTPKKTNKDSDNDVIHQVKSASCNTPKIIKGGNSAKVLKTHEK